MEYNRNCNSSGTIHGNCECHNIPFNLNHFDRKLAVRVTNTTESPYTVNKNTQIAEISVVTLEQSRFIKPVDTAILSMISEGDLDLITYLTELLRTNKPDQQNNTFWFPTPKNPGNIEDHTPIQTRTLKELRELQLKAESER